MEVAQLKHYSAVKSHTSGKNVYIPDAQTVLQELLSGCKSKQTKLSMTELGMLVHPHSGLHHLSAIMFTALLWVGPALSTHLTSLCLLLPVLPDQGFDPGSSRLPAPPGVHNYCESNDCTGYLHKAPLCRHHFNQPGSSFTLMPGEL